MACYLLLVSVVVFSLPSHWLHGVKHPSFVTVCFQHFLDVVHLCVLVSSSVIRFFCPLEECPDH